MAWTGSTAEVVRVDAVAVDAVAVDAVIVDAVAVDAVVTEIADLDPAWPAAEQAAATNITTNPIPARALTAPTLRCTPVSLGG